MKPVKALWLAVLATLTFLAVLNFKLASALSVEVPAGAAEGAGKLIQEGAREAAVFMYFLGQCAYYLVTKGAVFTGIVVLIIGGFFLMAMKNK